MRTSQSPASIGVCPTHGPYDGRRCRACAKTRALARLRGAAWEATQFLDHDEVRAYVDRVLDEIDHGAGS